VSVAELEDVCRPISDVARWLVDLYAQLPPFVQPGATLTFGDSPLVSATTFDPAALPATTRPVRRLLDGGRHGAEVPGRTVRVLQGLDPRLNLADFFALLRQHAAQQR
jgi:hypothetical protein